MSQPWICLLALAAVALTACAPAPGSDCGATALAERIGQPPVELAAAETPGRVRIIAPGSAVTMDFDPRRLNIETDDDGRATRLYCG